MCHRIMPLSEEELIEKLLHMGKASAALMSSHVPESVKEFTESQTEETPLPNAWPGSQVAVLLPAENDRFDVKSLTWGFDAPGSMAPEQKTKRIFNTRIETALEQLGRGSGFWYDALMQGRCLVPAWGFYEPHGTKRATDPLFMSPTRKMLLMAGISKNGRFSVVTTEPNDTVSPYHNRMPLVLAPGESKMWLLGNLMPLVNRENISLDVV
ncbi:MAG: SOS response-associated peptidase family protein [Coriobacteriales bacterium]|nr:SOS response-associated peptidase family protein [Coriobacteriales bacterium]